MSYRCPRGAPQYRCRYRDCAAALDSPVALSAWSPPRLDGACGFTLRPVQLDGRHIDDLTTIARFSAEAETALRALLSPDHITPRPDQEER